MEGKAHFVDILEPRRTQTGIFKFMTKDWYPTRTQVLDKNYTPQDLKDITAQSLYLDTVIEAESAKTGVSKEKLKKEVLSYIEEIGLDKKMHVIRWLGMFAIKLAFNMKIGIFVNEPAILRIKSMMGKHPVLFLPTHRSYADFCVMTYLCYHYDIQFPAVASGMDFYSMAVIGQVLRETCAFYIRRSLAGAALYAAALRQYVRTLVAKHDAPIEFFLEGTRSRSNKSMPPKFGMLSMALAGLAAREVPDVTLVPVHISYDRLLEQGAFACEHLGVPKPRESTRGLLKWLSTLNEEFGNMYINFGEPISAREYLRDAAPPDEALKPAGLQQISGAGRSRVAALGWAAAGAAAGAGAAGAAQLVAAVLAASLHAARPRPTPHRRLLHEMGWHKKVLEALGMTVLAEDLPKEVERILRVHARSWTLDSERCLRLLLRTPGDARKQEVVLSAAHVRAWLPVIELQLSVNPLLARLLPPALLLLLLHTGQLSKDALRRRYDELRTLLRYEFIYDEQFEDKTFEQAFEFCVNWGVVSCEEGGMVRGAGRGGEGGEGEGDAERLRFLLSWAAWPALTTLKLCMDVFSQRQSCSHEEALKLVQAAASESGAHPYCVSRIAAGLTLRALLAAGALLATGDKTSTYHAVPAAMARYQSLVEGVVPHFRVDFSENHPVFLDERARSRL